MMMIQTKGQYDIYKNNMSINMTLTNDTNHEDNTKMTT